MPYSNFKRKQKKKKKARNLSDGLSFCPSSTFNGSSIITLHNSIQLLIVHVWMSFYLCFYQQFDVVLFLHFTAPLRLTKCLCLMGQAVHSIQTSNWLRHKPKRIVSNSNMFISYCNATQMIPMKNALCYFLRKNAWEFDEKGNPNRMWIRVKFHLCSTMKFDREEQKICFHSFNQMVMLLCSTVLSVPFSVNWFDI